MPDQQTNLVLENDFMETDFGNFHTRIAKGQDSLREIGQLETTLANDDSLITYLHLQFTVSSIREPEETT